MSRPVPIARRLASCVLGGVCVLGALAGCGEPEGAPDVAADAAAEAAAKPAGRVAPQLAKARLSGGLMELRAESVGESVAVLRLRFRADGDDVTVRTYGTDGVVVRSEEFPVVGRTVLANDELRLEVEFDASRAGGGNLAVVAEGTFAGRPGALARTITIGEGRPQAGPAPELVEVGGRLVPVHRRGAREKQR